MLWVKLHANGIDGAGLLNPFTQPRERLLKPRRPKFMIILKQFMLN